MPTVTDLIGTWRVTGFSEWSQDGREQHPLGDQPVGYAILDVAGRVFIQLSKRPGRSMLPGDVAESFIAYFGTFKVDGDTLIVAIESGNESGDVATTQTRTITLDGDTLSIGIPRQFMATLQRTRDGLAPSSAGQ
jgi:Lipocalin-like domain